MEFTFKLKFCLLTSLLLTQLKHILDEMTWQKKEGNYLHTNITGNI